jgi:hypothetical protein
MCISGENRGLARQAARRAMQRLDPEGSGLLQLRKGLGRTACRGGGSPGQGVGAELAADAVIAIDDLRK